MSNSKPGIIVILDMDTLQVKPILWTFYLYLKELSEIGFIDIGDSEKTTIATDKDIKATSPRIRLVTDGQQLYTVREIIGPNNPGKICIKFKAD